MKKIIFMLALFATSISLFSSEPPLGKNELEAINKALLSEVKQLRDSLDALPDSTCVSLEDGSVICLPLKDAQLLGDSIWEYLQKKSSNGWPKDLLGWAFLIIGLFTGAEGARRITAGKEIYESLKPVLKSRLGLAVLSSAVVSAAIIAVLGSFSSFDWKLYLVLWPWVTVVASYIYEVFHKKDGKG